MVYELDEKCNISDGERHKVKACQAKNVVLLSLDNTFTKPEISIPEISFTDTNNGLFIGGHPYPKRFRHLNSKGKHFMGCIKVIIIEDKIITNEMGLVQGDITSPE